ncbi:MAG TPA: OsmC family protein [Caulobacteraceae bacterium]|nr:OsmC family protein [Caulobacteraceae bacterium]
MVHATQGAAPYRVDIVAAGHDLVADEPPANGGHNVGPGPFDLVVAGLAACTMITLRMYAARKGWAGFDISAKLRHRMVDRAHFIDREVEVSGVPDTAGLERLRDIVERTPVTLALKPGFTISTVLAETAPGAAA